MASLAALLKSRGHKITGSDENTYPPMSDFLKERGIKVNTPYAAENLQPHPDYVVLGNVLSRGNPEVEYSLESHLFYISMAELLKNEFIRGNTSVVITGTHGKTTTTSMAAHVLHTCKRPTGFLVGGIPENFGISSQDVKTGGYFVVEGDEYDTSLFDKRSKFFHYLPDRLIINNIEFDHADIFNDIDAIKKSFSLMLRQIPKNGLIIVNGDDKNAMEVVQTGYSPYISFGMGASCDAIISNCKVLSGKLGMTFDLTYKNQTTNFEIPILGVFNARNATSVILLALNEGIPAKDIQQALLNFKNVRRRLQQLTKNDNVRVFDDFAHHPTAINETLSAVRQAWPESRIHAVYEPRNNTSVRKYHQDIMVQAFEAADSVILYKLHREESINPEDRLDVPSIVSQLKDQKKEAFYMRDHDQIVEHCIDVAKHGDIFIVMSNGAFGGIQHRMAALLDKRC